MTIWIEALRIGVGYAIVPALVGSLLHELTHAVAVVLTGQRLHGMNLHHVFTNRRSMVRYEVTGNPAMKYVIGLAPLAVGLVGGSAYWLAVGWPSGPAGMALAIGWAFYTLQVSREDATGEQADDDREGKAIEGIFIALVGMTVLQVDYGPSRFIAWTLFGAGLALAAFNTARVAKAEQADDSTPQSGA